MRLFRQRLAPGRGREVCNASRLRGVYGELAFLEAVIFLEMLRRKTHADLDQLLVQIGPRIQVFGLVISGQRGQHARPGVDLGIQPCDLVPGVHDHRLVGIGQVFRHGTVGLRSSQAVGPFHLYR